MCIIRICMYFKGLIVSCRQLNWKIEFTQYKIALTFLYMKRAIYFLFKRYVNLIIHTDKMQVNIKKKYRSGIRS